MIPEFAGNAWPIQNCAGAFDLGAVLWDGFATIVLPRTVAPSHRLSGRFNRLSWWFWSSMARRISSDDLRLSFLAVYGPISVMMLLILWAGLIIVAFALIYHGLGPRFQASGGSTDFDTLLYMSGSTFLTLGMGDVTSADPTARLFMILEAGSGLIFLGLVITYMPLLHQAYASREVYNLLIHSRVGSTPVAIELLHRYTGPDRAEILRGHLRDTEHWMAETLQSHLAHPVFSFYRAQHWGAILARQRGHDHGLLYAGHHRRRRIGRGAGQAHVPDGPSPAQRPDPRAGHQG